MTVPGFHTQSTWGTKSLLLFCFPFRDFLADRCSDQFHAQPIYLQMYFQFCFQKYLYTRCGPCYPACTLQWMLSVALFVPVHKLFRMNNALWICFLQILTRGIENCCRHEKLSDFWGVLLYNANRFYVMSSQWQISLPAMMANYGVAILENEQCCSRHCCRVYG